MVEQTTNMGLDHNNSQAQFYKEAFAPSLEVTEALKAQVQTFNETLALACMQIVTARKERDDDELTHQTCSDSSGNG